MSRTGGEDQIVVIAFQIERFDFFCIDIHGLHFCKNHLNVPAFAKDGAHRRGNIGWRQRSRRHLIEQRLKEMIIGAVDHSDAHILAG